MKSGLEGRNNGRYSRSAVPAASVSMKSGLEGRNNLDVLAQIKDKVNVSMKSGLEGRNNLPPLTWTPSRPCCLNEVRPRRPEQLDIYWGE